MSKKDFWIREYSFNKKDIAEICQVSEVSNSWPLIYIIRGIKGKTPKAYIGETVNTIQRMASHLRHADKRKLSLISLITSDKFNISATKDIESKLIRYMQADGKFDLMNEHPGLLDHSFFQKEDYERVFDELWEELIQRGICLHSRIHIENTNLFKYSPYKSLKDDQYQAIVDILRSLLDDEKKAIIAKGGAGTGKTILATFLFKLLMTSCDRADYVVFGDHEAEIRTLAAKVKSKFPCLAMGLVIPMASFRKTVSSVFVNVHGLNGKMVIGPTDVSKRKYDILLVDEAHRLRKYRNLGAYAGKYRDASERLGLSKEENTELDWIQLQSKKFVLFYDEKQSIRPSDIDQEVFEQLVRKDSTAQVQLTSQFRVRGGNKYIKYVEDLMSCNLGSDNSKYFDLNYDFLYFDEIADLISRIKLKDQEVGLSRLVAGFAWKWISKNDTSKFDIEIEGFKLKWNKNKSDWINSEDAINEVGCIHKTQGYDLNYTAVIFGSEISYDREKNEIIINRENYHDKYGKQSVDDINDLKAYIINIYKTLMLRGIRGTYVYACDPSFRDYLSQHVMPFKKEEDKVIQFHRVDKVKPFQDAIPVYEDLQVAASGFGNESSVEDVMWVRPPVGLKASEDLFVCRIHGNSMNKIIEDGELAVFRRYTGGSRNGLIVLVELTDVQDPETGSRYTIKEYESVKKVEGELWENETIILHPKSTDKTYKPILLKEDGVQGLKVIGVFEKKLSWS